MTPARQLSGRPVFGTVVFYVTLIVLAATTTLLTNYINARPYVLVPDTDLTALSKAQDAYAAVGNLLTTLATGLLAGLGLFLTSRPKQRYANREIWLAVISAVCVCLSLYWGYVSAQNVEWAIEGSVPTLDLVKIQWPRNLQFYAMVLGLFFFADFVRRDVSRMD